MSSLFKQFQMDDKKQTDGIEIKYGANDDGTVPTFRLLRSAASNKRYAKVLEQETAPYRHLIRLNTLSAEVANKIYIRVFCKAVLISWDNVLDMQNKPITYSVDNAITLMETLPELFDDLYAQSGNVALFRAVNEDVERKN